MEVDDGKWSFPLLQNPPPRASLNLPVRAAIPRYNSRAYQLTRQTNR